MQTCILNNLIVVVLVSSVSSFLTAHLFQIGKEKYVHVILCINIYCKHVFLWHLLTSYTNTFVHFFLLSIKHKLLVYISIRQLVLYFMYSGHTFQYNHFKDKTAYKMQYLSKCLKWLYMYNDIKCVGLWSPLLCNNKE